MLVIRPLMNWNGFVLMITNILNYKKDFDKFVLFICKFVSLILFGASRAKTNQHQGYCGLKFPQFEFLFMNNSSSIQFSYLAIIFSIRLYFL